MPVLRLAVPSVLPALEPNPSSTEWENRALSAYVLLFFAVSSSVFVLGFPNYELQPEGKPKG